MTAVVSVAMVVIIALCFALVTQPDAVYVERQKNAPLQTQVARQATQIAMYPTPTPARGSYPYWGYP